MFLYPNRERWFLNISSRNNWINITKYSFLFNRYRFFNFFFNRWVIFKPLLFREINMSTKSSELHLILSKRSHRNSIVFFIKNHHKKYQAWTDHYEKAEHKISG